MTDQQELTRQQAELLKVQSGQLEIHRQQFTDQREANARQAEVFELQTAELRESMLARALEEDQRRSAQASRAFVREDRHTVPDGRKQVLPHIGTTVVNRSDRPVYEVEVRWQRGSAKRDSSAPEVLGMVMPGAEASCSREFASDAEMAASGSAVTFRDAAGVVWICRPDGTLLDEETDRRARASRPRKAAQRLTREAHDLLAELARGAAAPPSGPAPPGTQHQE